MPIPPTSSDDADHSGHDHRHVHEHAGDRLHQLFLRRNPEVVGLIFLQMMSRSKDVSHLLFCQVGVFPPPNLKCKRQVLHLVLTVDRRGSGERDEDHVVGVAGNRAAPLLHHADDREAVAVQLDRLPDRVTQSQLPRDVCAQDGHALLRFLIDGRKEAPMIDPLIGHFLIRAVHGNERS